MSISDVQDNKDAGATGSAEGTRSAGTKIAEGAEGARIARGPVAAVRRGHAVGAGRAAQELALKRGEFELAVQLGHIRTTVAPSGGRRLVAWQEIDRLRSAEGFPDALRERVRTVGTAEGARLMSVSPGRFSRLARAGYITPVRFYLNRYRVIVWLYLDDELRAFAAGEPALLTGRFPQVPGVSPEAQEDRRPRNWRGRRVGHLLHQCRDPWEQAAVIACVLGASRVAEVVRDPYERAYLDRLRPDLAPGRPESRAAQATVGRLLVADHPDEIQWHRADLDVLLGEARRARPAPRPGPWPGYRPGPGVGPGLGPDGHGAEGPARSSGPARSAGPPRREGSGGLLTRLGVRRRGRPELGATR